MSIHVEKGEGVMLIAFERDEAMNAFDMANFATIEAALADASEDETIRAIVLIGRGGRAFSAGFDIHEMAGFDGQRNRDAFVRRDPVMLRVAEHRCPVIAAIDGICYGAGALLALASDIRVASPAFRLKVTAVGYGGANATWSLPAIVGAGRAKEILMTGRVVGADEALAIGLVSRIFPAKVLEAEALAMARAIAGHPPVGVQAIKQLVGDAASKTPAQGWQAEHDWMLANTDFGSDGGGLFTNFRERRGKAASESAEAPLKD